MLNSIIYYLWVGVIFTLVVDISTWYARKKGITVPENSEWNWNTRIFAVLIWPLGCIYFLIGFIYEITKKNNRNEK